MNSFEIFDGPRGGLTFEFIPSDHAFSGEYDYDRLGPDVFSIPEHAFLFIERAIAARFPDWSEKLRHWGVTWVSRNDWLEVFDGFSLLRNDLQAGVPAYLIKRRYVLYPGLLATENRFNRRSLMSFLDNFERRVRLLIKRYPYLLIGGI